MPYWDHASATHSGWRFRVALSRGPRDSFPQSASQTAPERACTGSAGRLPFVASLLSSPASSWAGAAAPSLRSEPIPFNHFSFGWFSAEFAV